MWKEYRGAMLAKGAEEEGEEEGSRLFSNKFYLGLWRSGLGSSAVTWRRLLCVEMCDRNVDGLNVIDKAGFSLQGPTVGAMAVPLFGIIFLTKSIKFN